MPDTTSETELTAFSPSLLAFLSELARNNERDWFRANKRRYEEDVVAPVMAFISAMAPRIESLSPHFLAIPRKTGGSMMRIYRDTRFSRDKTPYKTNVGIQFRHLRGRDIHAPGFYVHLEPDSVFLGVGMWRPGGEALRAIRRAIDEHPERWRRVRDEAGFDTRWSLGGDSLKRAPRGYREDHPLIDDLKRKDFIASRTLAIDDLYREGLPDRITADFRAAAPFMRFLCEAVGVPF